MLINKKEPIQIRALKLAEKMFNGNSPEGRYILARLRVKAAHAAKRAEKPKKSDFQKARDRLDQIFGKYIRARDSENRVFQCCTCNKIKTVEHMNAGHCYSRKYYAIRWNEQNCHGQCIYCNTQPLGLYQKHEEYIKNKYGDGVLNKLKSVKMFKTNRNPSLFEIEHLIKYYTEKLNNVT